MPKFHDLTSQRFGRLVVLRPDGHSRTKQIMWLCQCDCGQQHRARTGDLKSNKILSCGCHKREILGARGRLQRAHGQSGTRAYQSWMSMMQRCYNRANPAFKNYGGRGIAVDIRWHDFERFFADMGQREAGLTLERLENDGPYCLDNCVYASRAVQNRNRRNNPLIEFCGEKKILAAWAEILGIPRSRLSARLGMGWTIEEAFTVRPGLLRSSQDLVGRRFGRLLVIAPAAQPARWEGKRKWLYWLCRCDCGKEVVVSGVYLRKGSTRSCGCLIEEAQQRILAVFLARSKIGQLIQVTHNGKTHSLREWSKITGIQYDTLYRRYRLGQDPFLWRRKSGGSLPMQESSSIHTSYCHV